MVQGKIALNSKTEIRQAFRSLFSTPEGRRRSNKYYENGSFATADGQGIYVLEPLNLVRRADQPLLVDIPVFNGRRKANIRVAVGIENR
jgi:hypothetical protein